MAHAYWCQVVEMNDWNDDDDKVLYTADNLA